MSSNVTCNWYENEYAQAITFCYGKEVSSEEITFRRWGDKTSYLKKKISVKES